MYRGRTIDDLLSDPLFLSSQEYKNYKDLVDAGVYPSIKTAILSMLEHVETIFKLVEIEEAEDRAVWPDEIRAAVKADSEGRVFPPLLGVARCIKSGDFHAIPEEHWNMLADFLEGEHRGGRGRPRDKHLHSDKQVLAKFEELISSGFSASRAQGELAGSQKMDIRSIQRLIKRTREIIECERESEALGKKLSQLDMRRFFLDDT